MAPTGPNLTFLLNIVFLVLLSVIHPSSTGEYSGLLSNLYKKASDQNRPLVLVLDNNNNAHRYLNYKDSRAHASDYKSDYQANNNDHYKNDHYNNDHYNNYHYNNYHSNNYHHKNFLNSLEAAKNEDGTYPHMYLYQLGQEANKKSNSKRLSRPYKNRNDRGRDYNDQRGYTEDNDYRGDNYYKGSNKGNNYNRGSYKGDKYNRGSYGGNNDRVDHDHDHDHDHRNDIQHGGSYRPNNDNRGRDSYNRGSNRGDNYNSGSYRSSYKGGNRSNYRGDKHRGDHNEVLENQLLKSPLVKTLLRISNDYRQGKPKDSCENGQTTTTAAYNKPEEDACESSDSCGLEPNGNPSTRAELFVSAEKVC